MILAGAPLTRRILGLSKIFNTLRMAYVDKSVLISHSPEQMFDLVAGVEDYPGFLPWCGGSEVQNRETLPDGSERVLATIRIRYRGITQSFTTENVQRRGEFIRLNFREGPFKALDGSWIFKPLGGHGCKIEFRLHYEFSNRILDGLVGPVFGQIANSFVDSFTRRADEVYTSPDES
jgi:ribosome-associated toxin RatA of RatAB toxin-antitoxin module